MLKEALQSSEDDDQRALNMICSKVHFIKIDTDNIVFENCMNDRECIKNSDAFVVQTPGQYSVERYSRVVREYGKYFILEVVIIILFIYVIRKTCAK